MGTNPLWKATLIAAGAFLCLRCGTEPADSGISERAFIDPSIENRPLALWPWLNGFVDTAKLVYELEEMKHKGMRGAVIWDIGALADPGKMIPAGPAFLGDSSLAYISLALRTADRLGLDLGMVASSSWNAGGAWVKEEDASMQLLLSSRIVSGPGKQKMAIEPPKSELAQVHRYDLITSLAVPYSDANVIPQADKVILLDAFTTADKKMIDWEVPEGKWKILSLFMSPTGQPLVVPSPNSSGLVIDHLSLQATQRHFDSMLVKLEQISTPDRHLKLLMLDSYEVWPMKDWTPNLVEQFIARYDYDPSPFLPLLLGYSTRDSMLDERFRADYSRLVSDLMVENHFGQSVDIADQYGIEMLTEAGHGGYPRVDPLKALGHSHIPMGEFWNRRWFWVTKEAASAAHLYGKKVVAAESLTGWNHWQHGPADFKQLIDIAFCQGLNQVVFHTFAHNPAIAGKPGFVYHAGEHINVNTTWWDMARPFMDYISRSSYLLRQGNFVGDACLYYGDQAPNLVPPERIDPNITPRYSEETCLHCGKPKPVDAGDMTGYDFDYMNAEIINTAMQVEDGRLVLPSGQSYRVLLLPERRDISLDVLRSLERLVTGGAVILGPKPDRSTSLKNYPACDLEVRAIADRLWGEADGSTVFSNKYGEGTVYWGKSLRQVLQELDVPPDFEVAGEGISRHQIDYIHRRTDTEEIYFVSNSSPEQKSISCTFRVDPDWIPELWDASSGSIQRQVIYAKADKGINMELVLDPLASIFVVFRRQAKGESSTSSTEELQFGKIPDEGAATAIDLTKHWEVRFDTALGGPLIYKMEELTSWPDTELDGIRHYSGTATYFRTFVVGDDQLADAGSAYLLFEDVQETARIWLNGQDCGVIWIPPYRVDITQYLQSGPNEIRVEVTNTWNNRIVGDLRNPDQRPFTRTNAAAKLSAEGPLLPSGLIGRAQLLLTREK